MKKGQKMTDEQRLKISLSKQGKGNGRLGSKHSEETKAKMSNAAKGKDVSHLNWTGKTHTEESRKKISEANKVRFARDGHPLTGFKFSKDSKRKMSESHIGQIPSEETRKKLSESHKGPKHWNWKEDRNSIKKSEKKHVCSFYKQWMLQIKARDNWECQLKDLNCLGGLEAHHIFNWCDYPNLRYYLNNGITLCHFHHPRGRKEEKRLEEIFLKLIEDKTSVSIKRN